MPNTIQLSRFYHNRVTEDFSISTSTDHFPYSTGFSDHSDLTQLIDLHNDDYIHKYIDKTFSDRVYRALTTISNIYDEYPNDKIAVMWSGGIDSTILLYLTIKVAKVRGHASPTTIFIESPIYQNKKNQMEKWGEEFGVDIISTSNEGMIEYAAETDISVGDSIPQSVVDNRISEIFCHSQKDTEHSIPDFVMDNTDRVYCQLAKSIPKNIAIFENKIECVLNGERWTDMYVSISESDTRVINSLQKYGYDKNHPTCISISAIPHFIDADIWRLFWRAIVPDILPKYPDNYIPLKYTHLPNGISHKDIPLETNYWKSFSEEEVVMNPNMQLSNYIGESKNTNESDTPHWDWSLEIEHNTEINVSQRDQDTLKKLRSSTVPIQQ